MGIESRSRLSQRIPFDPARLPFFYGWVIAVVGTFGMIATVPATPPGFAPFVDPMMKELEVTRASLTFAFTWGTILAGVAIPFAGFWVDRLGVRVAAMMSYFFLGLSMVTLSYPLYFSELIQGLGLSEGNARFVFLLLIFFSLRFWGLGMAMTACRSMVFRWIVRWRSIVAGVNGMILSLSFSSAPWLLNGFVVSFGWQETWRILGVVAGVVFVILAFFFFRDSPEDCGIPVQRPDNEDSDPDSIGLDASSRKNFTAFEAMATLAFWLMVAGLAMNAFIGTGTAFHVVSIGKVMGDLGRDSALQLLLFAGIFNAITSITLGFVTEKIRLRYLLFFMMACQTISLIGLLNFREPLGFWSFAVGSGCAWGTFGILISVPWPRFFGRKHLGSINGIVTGAVVVFSAIGPYAFGLSHDSTGSYRSTVIGCLCLTPVLALLGLLARNPRRNS